MSKDIRVGVNIVTSKEIEDNKEIDLIYEHKNSIAINPSAVGHLGMMMVDIQQRILAILILEILN